MKPELENTPTKQNGIEIPEEMRNQMTIGGGDDEDDSDDSNLQSAPEPQKVMSQPVYLGGKRFESNEELIAYAADLQNKVTRYDVEREYNAPSQAMQNANTPKVSDLMFSDPEAFVQVIEENAEKRILGKIGKAEAEKKIWDNFYKKYPDLQDSELSPIVEFQFNKKKNDLGNLPADQMLDSIGKDVRSLIGKVRGKPGEGRELPSGGAVVASSTNNVPQQKAVVKSEPEDMASQLRRFQKRGR